MISKKIFIAGLFVLCGAVVFVLGSPYYSIFPTNGNKNYYIAITLFFLLVSILLKRNQSLSRYSPAVYSLFSASAALLFLSTGILNLQRSTMPPLQNLALDKFSQFLHVVPVIVLLTLLAKGNLKSIFIGIGKLKQGLAFGLISFVSFAVIALVMGVQSSGFFSSLKDAVPLLLLFIFSNAIMEELWFRGIFLKNYESIMGRTAAITVTAIVFGASHVNATYEFPGGGFVFGLVVFVLGLIGAHAMSKYDSLIGPVLFHAGYDLLVIIPVLNTF
jgi:membrane protease YdiL (CAAX protease family)